MGSSHVATAELTNSRPTSHSEAIRVGSPAQDRSIARHDLYNRHRVRRSSGSQAHLAVHSPAHDSAP
jgi:hypothetical protein